MRVVTAEAHSIQWDDLSPHALRMLVSRIPMHTIYISLQCSINLWVILFFFLFGMSRRRLLQIRTIDHSVSVYIRRNSSIKSNAFI